MTKDEFNKATGYNEYRTVKVSYFKTPISGTVERVAGKDGYLFRIKTNPWQSSRNAHQFYFSDVEWIG